MFAVKQGNKGAVAARMKIHDSTVCFVCSHLAAHRDNVAGRNSDFHNIVSKIVFANGSASLEGTGAYHRYAIVEWELMFWFW